MSDKRVSPKRKGGMKKRFKTFISFADEYAYKAALIAYALSKRVSFSVVAREMVSEYIEAHKIEIPTTEAAEEIVRQFANPT